MGSHSSSCHIAYSAKADPTNFPIQLNHGCLCYIGTQLKPQPRSSWCCNAGRGSCSYNELKIGKHRKDLVHKACLRISSHMRIFPFHQSFLLIRRDHGNKIRSLQTVLSLVSSPNKFDFGTQGMQSCSIPFHQCPDAWLPPRCLTTPPGCRKLKETRTMLLHSARKEDSQKLGQ